MKESKAREKPLRKVREDLGWLRGGARICRAHIKMAEKIEKSDFVQSLPRQYSIRIGVVRGGNYPLLIRMRFKDRWGTTTKIHKIRVDPYWFSDYDELFNFCQIQINEARYRWGRFGR